MWRHSVEFRSPPPPYSERVPNAWKPVHVTMIDWVCAISSVAASGDKTAYALLWERWLLSAPATWSSRSDWVGQLICQHTKTCDQKRSQCRNWNVLYRTNCGSPCACWAAAFFNVMSWTQDVRAPRFDWQLKLGAENAHNRKRYSGIMRKCRRLYWLMQSGQLCLLQLKCVLFNFIVMYPSDKRPRLYRGRALNTGPLRRDAQKCVKTSWHVTI